MFLNAVMLAGIAAAALPIVLHLLSRARYRRVEWGAMMFLQDTQTRQIDRSKLAQYLLLLLRVLAIGLLAVALARPVTRKSFGPADAQRLAAVIVIDTSPSMEHPEQSASRLDLARRAALGVLGGLQRGDQVGLVTLGQPADRDQALTTDLQDIASRLASLQAAFSPADLGDGVRRAAALLNAASEVPREIYLISDRQEGAWRGLDQLPVSLRKGSRLIAIPVGSTDNANAWIESVALTNEPAIAGLPTELEIRVRNGGSVARSDLPVSITLDNRELDSTRLYLAPGSTEVIRRRITLPRPGGMIVSVSIGASGVPSDDTASLAIDVVEPIRVLVISGETPAQLARTPAPDFSGETDYLRLSLTPFSLAGQRGQDPFRFRVVSEKEWPELDPKRDRVVVLANVNALDARRVRALDQFVFAGGGLLLAPGSRTDPKVWNQWLYRDGQGTAPAPIESFRNAGDDIVRLVGVSTSHEVFSFFAGRPDPLPPVSVLRWARFSPVPAGSVLASLQSGDPMMLYRTFGRGRVIATAIPIDADWSNFSYSNLYLPTMQSVGRYLASAANTPRNLSIGAAIEVSFDAPHERFALVTRPDGRVDRVPMSISGGAGTVIYPDTDLAGRYIVRAPGNPAVTFVVQGSPAESDLNLLDDDHLRTIARSAGASMVSPENIADTVGQSRRSTELSLGLIAAAMALLGLELLLAQRSIPKTEGAPA